MLLKTWAMPYLVRADPDDILGREQIETIIEMVREWAESPKPQIAKRAGGLLANFEQVREAAHEIRVAHSIKPEMVIRGKSFDPCWEALAMAKAWKKSKQGPTLAHIKALQLFLDCIVA